MTTPTTQRKSLRALRESTGTLFAQNTGPTKITCNTDTISFDLEPAGYDDSIRIVPKECLNQPGFQRLWMRGTIKISDDPEMEDQITLLMGGQVEQIVRAQVQNEDGTWRDVAPSIEKPRGHDSFSVDVDNDPTSRTYGQAKPAAKCLIGAEPVYQTDAEVRDGLPPLCPVHVGESYRVVSTPQADGSWNHQLTTIQAPEKGLE